MGEGEMMMCKDQVVGDTCNAAVVVVGTDKVDILLRSDFRSTLEST